MLNDQQILSDIYSLPQEKQAEVLDFIAFVKSRNITSEKGPNDKRAQLIQLLHQASNKGVFQSISDPLVWQEQIRNEWE